MLINTNQYTGKYKINLKGAIPESIATETANAGRFYNHDGKSYYVKLAVAHIELDLPKKRFFAAAEVASNTITRLLASGTEGAPRSFIATDVGNSTGFYMASERIEYKDLGVFLQERDSIDQLKLEYADLTENIVNLFKKNADEISRLSSGMREMRMNRRNDWWKIEDKSFVDIYRAMAQPFRELVIENLKLLPEPLQKMVQEHIFIGQIVGEWDVLNDFFQNIGFSKNSDGKYRAASLDRGASFGIGFWGQSKQDGYRVAVDQRPPAFLVLQNTFEQGNAGFSEKLPKLGSDFSNLPYADVAQLSFGKSEWVPDTLNRLAYRIQMVKGKHADKNLFHHILMDTLMDPSEADLDGKNFTKKSNVNEIMNARLDAVITQAGGNEVVREWAIKNPIESEIIRSDVNALRMVLSNEPAVTTPQLTAVQDESEVSALIHAMSGFIPSNSLFCVTHNVANFSLQLVSSFNFLLMPLLRII